MDRRQKMCRAGARIFLSFIGTCGFCYTAELAGFRNASYSVFGVTVFSALWLLCEKTRKNLGQLAEPGERRRRIIFAAAVSYLFALAMIMGYQLQSAGMTDGGFAGKGLILIRSACLGVGVFPFANFLFQGVERIGSGRKERAAAGRVRPIVVFGVCAGAVFVLLIPVWLAYYPIIMSYDFHRQVNEAHWGLDRFYPYQPIAHTWIIWVFMQLGNAVGSLQTGYACMAVFQMLLYALATGYACNMLYRITGRIWPAIAAVIFFAIFPFNSVMVLCTTKDTVFTVLFLLFFLLLVERSLSSGRKKIVIEVLLVIEGCTMMQFRNNAFYAVAVAWIFLVLLVPRREKLRVLLLGAALVIGGRGMGAVIKQAIGTKLEGARVEMFSVPIQQMARVGYYHGGQLDDPTRIRLEKYMDCYAWEKYNPPLADTVKNNVVPGSFDGNYGELFSIWLELGSRYPNEYIDAFLELTRGYWFPDDVSWAENLGYGPDSGMGAVFTYTSSEVDEVGPIERDSRLPWLELQLEKIVSANCFYDWPVVSILFKSAFYAWAFFLMTAAMLYRRQYGLLRLVLFPWIYFGTMLMGPVVQLRYIFPIMAILPVMAGMLSARESKLSNSLLKQYRGQARDMQGDRYE